VTVLFRSTCPTCEDGYVETAPMYWGATAEDSSPAEFEVCPDCKGTKKCVSEVRDLDRKPTPAELEEYDPFQKEVA